MCTHTLHCQECSRDSASCMEMLIFASVHICSVRGFLTALYATTITILFCFIAHMYRALRVLLGKQDPLDML